MEKSFPHFVSLGDSAIVIQWRNTIDRSINVQVNAVAKALRNHPFTGLIDLIPAYSSLTVYYDVMSVKKHLSAGDSIINFVQQHVKDLMQHTSSDANDGRKLVEIPICYDTQLSNDLEAMSMVTGLSVEEIISLHGELEYYVYMLGFLPGYAYMGEVDERIAFARKDKPIKVRAGAVGIAGRQTGIYPVDSPGGWQIVGYTPLKIFDAQAANPCLISAGDWVKFIPIDIAEYDALKNKQTA